MLRQAQKSLTEEQAQIEEDRDALVALCNGLLEDLFECKKKVRIAEKFINDLKASGQDSVEDLVEQLADYCKPN